MYPISRERLKWIEARRFLLGRMIQELTLRQSRYQQPRNVPHQHAVMESMIREQLQLTIEENAIDGYFEETERAGAKNE